MIRSLLRVTAYPVVFGLSFWVVLVIVARPAWRWPGLAAVAVAAMMVVAVLERVIPYQRAWLEDHDDLAADIAHALVNLALLAGTAFALSALRVDLPSVWPDAWPAWAQLLLAGAVMDLGLYLMHRASHHFGLLWRLHAPHHSSERLYWLNGERRHPLSAMLLAGPGLVTVIALGAPPVIISAWLTMLAVHLAFQHANVDYRMGPLRYVLGVAEIHRWHHKREYEDAQVNFGEFWMLWDHLGRTFHDRPNGVVAGEIGLRDRTFPTAYVAQLFWPFERQASRQRPERRQH